MFDFHSAASPKFLKRNMEKVNNTHDVLTHFVVCFILTENFLFWGKKVNGSCRRERKSNKPVKIGLEIQIFFIAHHHSIHAEMQLTIQWWCWCHWSNMIYFYFLLAVINLQINKTHSNWIVFFFFSQRKNHFSKQHNYHNVRKL